MHDSSYNMLLKAPNDRLINLLCSGNAPQLGRRRHGRQEISPFNQEHITQ